VYIGPGEFYIGRLKRVIWEEKTMWHKERKCLCLLILSLLSLTLFLSCATDTVSPTGESTSQAVVTSTPTSEPSPIFITLPEALANGKPTLAEFGSKCLECMEMNRILIDLDIQYQDKINFSILDVYKYEDLANSNKVMVIPTQIIFDSTGKEVIRHVGFWPADELISQLRTLGLLQ
jgi:thioredoxin 1